MLNRLWLLFAQSVTMMLAACFVVATLKPDWISGLQIGSIVQSVTLSEGAYDNSALSPGSYHDAVKKIYARCRQYFYEQGKYKT